MRGALGRKVRGLQAEMAVRMKQADRKESSQDEGKMKSRNVTKLKDILNKSAENKHQAALRSLQEERAFRERLQEELESVKRDLARCT